MGNTSGVGPAPSVPNQSHDRSAPKPTSPRLPSSPIIVHPLPSSSALTLESQRQSKLELDRQTRQRQLEKELAEALQEQQWSIERQVAIASLDKSSVRHSKDKGKRPLVGGDDTIQSKRFPAPPQAYELYAAIDRKDIDFIMRVRDHAFGLLLQKNAGEFPIVYASRIGEGHRDVVILLVGAMSRYVNHLEPEDFEKKSTQNMLKALRSNLKLAIDNALLPAFSPALLSSYLQVLIMSEGDSWLHKAVYEISLLVRDPHSQPAKAAEAMVRGFCTKELRGVQGGVNDVEEYIANAALDLVIMACWSVTAGQMNVDVLPTYSFARDTRTWTMLQEAMTDNKAELGKANARLRKTLERLLVVGGDSKKSIRGRLKDVERIVDGEG